ncbi:MAG TPA: rhomboid family intramembrane serine protease [Thermoleophilaceae bacterium]|nr:rhomboid family intramembrane serine protease [Thermoleophilaceae bacterium]
MAIAGKDTVVAAIGDLVTVRRVTGKAPTPGDPRRDAIRIVIALVAVMWVLEVVDVALDHRLDRYGIEPRDPDGLDGVLTAPFLHVGFAHLIGNTIPFVVMGVVIAFEGPLRLLGVTAIAALASGLGTWVVAPENSIHLGASGVVFGYATYLIARGWFNRRGGEIAIGVAVAVLWGGTLLAGLEPQRGISWQGHLFGAIGGLVAAWVLARPGRPAPVAPP